MGMDRLLERLAQEELAALRGGDVAVRAQHDVVGCERVGGDEEAQVAAHDAALVFRQPVRVLPQGDVAGHVHFLRHPVVGAGRQILLPGPLVLERHQLIDVGPPVDDPLVGHVDAARVARRGVVCRRRHAQVAAERPGRGGRRIVPCQHLLFSCPASFVCSPLYI